MDRQGWAGGVAPESAWGRTRLTFAGRAAVQTSAGGWREGRGPRATLCSPRSSAFPTSPHAPGEAPRDAQLARPLSLRLLGHSSVKGQHLLHSPN